MSAVFIALSIFSLGGIGRTTAWLEDGINIVVVNRDIEDASDL